MRALWLLALSATFLSAQDAGSFTLLGQYRGLGGMLNSTLGPGPEKGGLRFYLSYIYVRNTIGIVAADPETGAITIFQNPTPTEYGAWALAAGPDGNIYYGTLPNAHFLKLDPKSGKITDLGRPSETEQYIWNIAVGADSKLYGCTYPQAKLVRLDPATGRMDDLGRMDPAEQYARYVAASRDGFVYIGIGTTRANLVAYEIATGTHREILAPEFQGVGMGQVWRGEDGAIYANVRDRHFRLSQWTATPIPEASTAPAETHNRLADGRTLSVTGRTLTITNPATKQAVKRELNYSGEALDLFRVGLGPDGHLYASTMMPIQLSRFDQAAKAFVDIGNFGGGEFYSFLPYGNLLLGAAYSAVSPLMTYDPARPFTLAGERTNPTRVNFAGSDSGWRPEALIRGPGDLVYVGAVSGYGKLGGPLCVWDVAKGAVTPYDHVVPNQSVVSLASWKDQIVGGTTVGGGGGSHPTEKEAKVFLWDTVTRAKVFETVAVLGAASVTGLITAPNGRVYGFAGRTLFVFDPEARVVRTRKPLPFAGSPIYNAVEVGPDGRIWGLVASGVFAIDPKTDDATLVAAAPEKITGGFAMKDGAIYFICGAKLYSYRMPKATVTAR